METAHSLRSESYSNLTHPLHHVAYSDLHYIMMIDEVHSTPITQHMQPPTAWRLPLDSTDGCLVNYFRGYFY